MPIIDPADPTTLTTAALNGAEAAVNLALIGSQTTLAQAAAAKTGLVAAIFNALRVQPIAYALGGTAYNWDASDEAAGALSAALASYTLAALSGALGSLTTGLGNLQSDVSSAFSNVQDGANPGYTGVDFSGLSALASLQWTPLGATAPVTLTAAQAQGLIAAIAARRATLQGVRLTQLAAIAGAGTVAAIVALSVSSGWGTP